LPERAADALGEFGPHATAAVPELLAATTNADEDLRIAATDALLKIAPEALKKNER
jgi:HEAT repeat protein